MLATSLTQKCSKFTVGPSRGRDVSANVKSLHLNKPNDDVKLLVNFTI